jgi:hypothetical protein
MLVHGSSVARHVVRGRRCAAQGSVVLACAMLLASCHSFRPKPAGSLVSTGESVRVEFPAAETITLRPSRGDEQSHAVRVVEGRIERVSGDTLELRPTRIDATGRTNLVRVPPGARTTIVLPPGSSVGVARISGAKTTVAILGTGALVLLAVALVALGQMDDAYGGG